MIGTYNRPFPRSEATGVGKQSPGMPAPPLPPFRYDYFVSPTGSSSAAGTFGDPWSLAFAISGAGGLILPGVHVGILGGQYIDGIPKHFAIAGTDIAPIIWRNYNGQWVEFINDTVSKGPSVIEIAAPYNRFWGIDAWRKHTDRFNYPGPGTVWWVQDGATDGTYLIHCWGHEGSNGLFVDSDVGDVYVYNSYFMHAGVSTDPRAHGFYVHHKRDSHHAGSRLILSHCFSFDHLGNCGQIFASGPPEQMDDISVIWLTAWGGGRLATTGAQVNLTFGGTDSAAIALRGFIGQHIISRNPVGFGSANLRFYGGGAGINQDALLEDAYLVGGTSGSGNGRLSIDAMAWTSFKARRNTMINLEQTFLIRTDDTDYTPYDVWEDQAFFGSDPSSLRWRSGPGFTDRTWTGWKAFTGKGSTGGHLDTAQTALPATTRVFIEAADEFEYGRGHVVVFNFAALARVPVDLGDFLAIGDTFVVRNVQESTPERNPTAKILAYDAPVGGNVVSVWTGVPVYLPMDGVSAPPAYGFNNAALNSMTNAPKSGPDFDCFVVSTS